MGACMKSNKRQPARSESGQYALKQRALRAMVATQDLAEAAAANKIRLQNFSLDDEEPEFIRHLSPAAKPNASVDRAIELLRGAHLLAVAAAMCAIGRESDMHRALASVDRIYKAPLKPDLESLCAYAERATAYADGYVQSVVDLRRATGERGAKGSKTKGEKLKDLLRHKATRLKRERDLKKNEAAIVLELELPHDIKAKAGYIERLLGQMFPGEAWDEIHSSDEEPSD